jgi:hypothetical protein
MRKLSLLFTFLNFFLFVGSASATTYYISYSSGSNANNGTSESTPWKTHPFMQSATACTGSGSAPNYSHSAGDQFVFKQGDSWPNACFDMAIQSGGSAGNPDVYTFDPAWGTPGGTTGNAGQPVGTYQFNAGGAAIHGSDGFNRFIAVNTSNVTLNGIEFTGITWTGSPSYGNVQGIYVGGSTNVTISKIYAHNWTHGGATSDTLSWVVGYAGNPYNAGDRVTGSVFDGAGASDSGEAVYLIPNLDNNIVRNMSNGLLPNANAVVHDNQVGPINKSFDASDHENCFEPVGLFPGFTSTNYFYNNVWHDCYAVGILTQGGASSSGVEIDYIWNNVAYTGNVATIPLQFDSVSTSNSSSQIHAWNNTIYGGSSLPCMRTVSRGNGNFGILDIQNNHCISDSSVISLGVGGNIYTNNNNLLTASATASSLGFTSSETFAYSPTSSSSPTIGAGANLSVLALVATLSLDADTTFGGVRSTLLRPLLGAWDVGAYQFSGSVSTTKPAPPTGVQVIKVQ